MSPWTDPAEFPDEPDDIDDFLDRADALRDEVHA